MTKDNRVHDDFDSFCSPRDAGGFPMAIYSVGSYGCGEYPRCSLELDIVYLNQEIRNKNEWWLKVKNPSTVETWKTEILRYFRNARQEEQRMSLTGLTLYNDDFITSKVSKDQRIEHQFAYSLAECRYLSQQYAQCANTCIPAAADGVFARWDPIPDELSWQLRRDIQILHSSPAIGSNKEDRHPGTPQMVDLVHPSLYAYERGVTHVLKNKGAEILKMPDFEDFLGASGIPEALEYQDLPPWCSRSGLQWLPSELYVESASDVNPSLRCHINSYINNLHPEKYPDLYQSLSELFLCTLPLLENVLAEVNDGKKIRQRVLRIPDTCPEYAEDSPREKLESETDEEYDNFRDRWYTEERPFCVPEIPEFTAPPKYNSPRVDVSLRNRPLQVIFKIASLELEPGQSYEGGVWHVEGMLDERIVATACCYLENDNIEGGELQFRTAVSEPDHEQYDHRGVDLLFGLKDQDILVQPRGQCKAGGSNGCKILAWPNTLQHRVNAVQLIDPSKSGKRVICCFFLVDPTLRIRSTATVPPQQHAWVAEQANNILAGNTNQLAEPVLLQIADNLCDGSALLSYEMACERRKRLMDERGTVTGTGDDENFFVRPFSLCEH